MELESPIVVAMGLDKDTGHVAVAATEIARRLKRQILPVHGQNWPKEDARAVRKKMLAYFGQAHNEGIVVMEPVILPQDPTQLVVETAARAGAHMIVAGPGRPETVIQWLLGSTTYGIVRHASQPVYLARGTVPGGIGRLITCPIDLSPQSRMGLTAGLRMARVFESKLRIIHVVSPDHAVRLSSGKIDSDADHVADAEESINKMLDAHDTEGVEIEIVVVSGRPSVAILENSLDAQLVVLGSRSFRWLLPGTFGSTTEKVLRKVPCSVLAVRDPDADRDTREERLKQVARLRGEARDALDKDPARTVELVRLASLYAPMNAALHELLADAFEKLGQTENADAARKLAARIRKDFH